MTAPSRSYFVGGVLICLVGAVCFSTKAIFVKLAYRDTSVDAVTLLALRMLFSVPFFAGSAIVASSRRDNVRFTPRQWIYIGVIGCLGYYISSLLDFLGLQYVSAGIERLILFIYPTLVLLMSGVLFKEKIQNYQWAAVAITYAGLLLAFVGEVSLHETPKNFFLGSIMIFACAVTYAMYLVGSGRMIRKVGAAKFNSYAMTFASVGVLLHFFVTSEASLWNQETTTYVYSLFMAIISTVLPSYLVTEGIRRVGADNAAIVGSIGPVSTIAQAAILLGEPIFLLQVAGTVMILIGVFLVGRKR